MMDKQMIEEMSEDLVKGEFYITDECMGTDCRDCKYRSKGAIRCQQMIKSEFLINAGYRKIPENAVVLTEEEYEELQKGVKTYNYTAMFNAQDAYRWEQGYLQGCKETAEKFAERLKEIEEALLDMVVQFCQIGDDDTLRHSFMSAEENAFDVLGITYGEKVADAYAKFEDKWTKPIDEIAKEITEDK